MSKRKQKPTPIKNKRVSKEPVSVQIPDTTILTLKLSLRDINGILALLGNEVVYNKAVKYVDELKRQGNEQVIVMSASLKSEKVKQAAKKKITIKK